MYVSYKSVIDSGSRHTAFFGGPYHLLTRRIGAWEERAGNSLAQCHKNVGNELLQVEDEQNINIARSPTLLQIKFVSSKEKTENILNNW